MEEKIKQENIKNITPLLMNLEKLELNETFDIVYANLSLHYFDDKTTIKIFDQLYELLNKGGFLFVKCKSIDDFKYGKGEKLGNDYYLFKGHKRHFFSKKYMEEKLKKFKIIKIRKTSSKHFNIGMGTSHALFIEAVATS